MTERNLRKLPPLSPKSDNGDQSDVPRRPKKKKKPVGAASELDTERGTPRSGRSSSRSRRGEEAEQVEAGTSTPTGRRRKAKQDHLDLTSGGEVTGESSTDVGRRKKKKKAVGSSRETLVGASEDAVTSGGEDGQLPTTSKKKKGKKKKNRQSGLSSGGEDDADYVGLAAELTAINDDVVEAKEENDEEETNITLAPPVMRSEPINKVFIERKSGFKTTDKEKLVRRQAEAQRRAMQPPPPVITKTTIQFGLSTHRVFKTMCLFCHGLLAGFAMWHIVMVFSLSSSGYDTFLEVYSPVALPVQCLYYFLFVLCTVAVCDRYDIGRPNRKFIVRAFTLQNGAVSVLVYIMSLIFSLAIANTDDKIGLYSEDPTLWQDTQKRDSQLNTWRILNVVRGVGAIFGWIIISLKPSTDRLSKNLERADDNIYGNLQPDNQHMDVIRTNGAV